MRRYIKSNLNNQAGVVSLFSVMFFMLLVTVLTVGFLQIMILEQNQSLNNDLSDSAKASAASGIEDGKRAILKYAQLAAADPLKAQFQAALNSTNCNAISGTPAVAGALGVDSGGNVVGNAQLNQYYTCLNVQLDTQDYVGQQQAGVSDYIPLKPTGGQAFDQIKVSWDLISASVGNDGDGQPLALAPGPAFLPVVNSVVPSNSWSQKGYPPYLRAQLYGYPSSGSFTRASLVQRSRTVMLVPSSSGAAVIDFGVADPTPGVFDSPKTAPSLVGCSSTFDQFGSYLCNTTLALPAGFPSTNNVFFLRLTPIYGQAHFRVQMFNSGTNSVVPFNEVQPIIDSTGRASDVYRRLQARVRVNPLGGLPEFVAETANNICKNEVVTSNTGDYVPNNCP